MSYCPLDTAHLIKLYESMARAISVWVQTIQCTHPASFLLASPSSTSVIDGAWRFGRRVYRPFWLSDYGGDVSLALDFDDDGFETRGWRRRRKTHGALVIAKPDGATKVDGRT
ncbi:hypothetical protein VIGAN_08225200 [Vigna angularis var. angularis]|uniref:Uncharacterized protein n=1 Tax=Vigna angularis var. angularis TaxID=157739 RepID=A0A0S3SRQ4_PHAAN|nr:hypothetical protein VIGAN_08225200 [Vigna angularis var. angularis]